MARKIDVYSGNGTAITVSRTETDKVQWRVEYRQCYTSTDELDPVIGRSEGKADLAIASVLAYIDSDISDLEDWIDALRKTKERLLLLQERAGGEIDGRWKDEFKRIFDKGE